MSEMDRPKEEIMLPYQQIKHKKRDKVHIDLLHFLTLFPRKSILLLSNLFLVIKIYWPDIRIFKNQHCTTNKQPEKQHHNYTTVTQYYTSHKTGPNYNFFNHIICIAQPYCAFLRQPYFWSVRIKKIKNEKNVPASVVLSKRMCNLQLNTITHWLMSPVPYHIQICNWTQ